MLPSILLRAQRDSGDRPSTQHMAWQGLISRCSRRVLHLSHPGGIKQYLIYKKYWNKSQQGGSVGNGTCHPVWQPEFDPQNPYTAAGCHLTSTCAPVAQTYKCAYNSKLKKYSNNLKNIIKGLPGGAGILFAFVVLRLELRASRYQDRLCHWVLPAPSELFCWQIVCKKIPVFLCRLRGFLCLEGSPPVWDQCRNNPGLWAWEECFPRSLHLHTGRVGLRAESLMFSFSFLCRSRWLC